MASLIGTGKMVAKAVYFNTVQCAPYWYTLSGEHTIVKVRHVLQTGLHLQLISVANKLPQACNRMEAMRQKMLKVTHLDHDAIMEEAIDWSTMMMRTTRARKMRATTSWWRVMATANTARDK